MDGYFGSNSKLGENYDKHSTPDGKPFLRMNEIKLQQRCPILLPVAVIILRQAVLADTKRLHNEGRVFKQIFLQVKVKNITFRNRF